jgi:hypothetical protein
MPLDNLTPGERRVIRECLRAAAIGPFFPMWEFQTLFGLEHSEVADIAFAPTMNDASPTMNLAINNAMNNLSGYPHKRQDIWSQYISVSPEEVRRILNKWADSSR